MIRFLIVSLITAIGLPSLVQAIAARGGIPQVPSFLFETTALVALFTAIIFVYLYRSDRDKVFVQLYLLSMAVKLVAYFAYVLIIILDDPPGAAANAVYFLLAYTIFTALEIGFLYGKITPPSGS